MATAGLWLTVLLSGIYHGANPAMGWPLAVSAGLMGRGRRDLARALWPLALGHALAMAAILLPFTLLVGLALWQREIRIGAALLVTGFGLGLLVWRRHPRFIARIKPTQLALWSFAVAMAHGAGLMLLPIYLSLCRAQDLDRGGQAVAELMRRGLQTAIAVSAVHTAAMILAGGLIALVVHSWLGLKFLSRGWLNLERVWPSSLVAVGAVALAIAWLDAA